MTSLQRLSIAFFDTVTDATLAPLWGDTAGGADHAFDDMGPEVGRCRLTVSNPVSKAHIISAPESRISCTAFNVRFPFQRAPPH